jgi:hypothetical protein
MEEKITSLKKTARIAGLLYFMLAIPAPYSLIYVPSKIMVRGDAAATANNILANEFLFRTAIAGQLISQTIFIFLVLVLYRLFKQVNEYQAKLMVALVIVSIPVAFLIEAFNVTALMILKGEVLKTLPPEQQQDLAMLFLKVHGYGIMIVQIFWGLWLIPFGLLVYKSEFIPRILGVLLIVAGIAYVIVSFTFLLFPWYSAFVEQYSFPFFFGELAMILWLLIKGVKNKFAVSAV